MPAYTYGGKVMCIVGVAVSLCAYVLYEANDDE